jgi:hypothetical protein
MIKTEDSLMFAATEKKLSLGLKLEGWTMRKISLALERHIKGELDIIYTSVI